MTERTGWLDEALPLATRIRLDFPRAPDPMVILIEEAVLLAGVLQDYEARWVLDVAARVLARAYPGHLGGHESAATDSVDWNAYLRRLKPA